MTTLSTALLDAPPTGGTRTGSRLPLVQLGLAVTVPAGTATSVVGGDPVNGMLSDAVHVPGGGAWLATCLAGLGVVALGTALTAHRRLPAGSLRTLVLGLLALWTVGLAAVAGFPTDLPGIGTTPSGRVHQAAVGVVVLVPAALALLVATGCAARTARALQLAAAGVAVLGAVFLVLHLPVVLGRDVAVPGVGLVERLLMAGVVVTALLTASALDGPHGAGRPAGATATATREPWVHGWTAHRPQQHQGAADRDARGAGGDGDRRDVEVVRRPLDRDLARLPEHASGQLGRATRMTA